MGCQLTVASIMPRNKQAPELSGADREASLTDACLELCNQLGCAEGLSQGFAPRASHPSPGARGLAQECSVETVAEDQGGKRNHMNSPKTRAIRNSQDTEALYMCIDR